MIQIGDQAPDFTLLNHEGTPIQLSKFRGKKVILFAFPKAGTPGCTAQACAFNDEFPRIQTQNAVVFGVNNDSIADLKQWHDGRKMQYDLLSDPKHIMLEPYGAWGIPLVGVVRIPSPNRSYWVLDETGIVIDMQIGVRPEESVRKALAALEKAPTSAG